ncbi:MAG: hypothetical protein OER95_01765 [Acidimicrobiia bacterium]|nr:hypothetical protein [Acidimicrobiia bacterium]
MATFYRTVDAVGRTVDERPRLIAGILFAIILFFVLACALNGIIPVCHYLFGCDHRFH